MQFYLYRNFNKQTQSRYPYLLDVQSDFLDSLKTRLVIPVMKLAEQKPITRLNPVFSWHKEQFLLVTQEMAAIPGNQLIEQVTELSEMRGEVLAAIDFLITGI